MQVVSEKIAKVDHKNEDFSGSVNRIDSGAIFPPRLAQELSRNAFVVSILLFLEKSLLQNRSGP